MSFSPDSKLTIKALEMVWEARGKPAGMMFHSDQGSHYTSRQFRQLLWRCRIRQSMSRRGNCHYNAVVESFFLLLKRENNPAVIFLITSKCFITVSVGMDRAIRCHRQNMNTSIINGSEVPRLSVVVQGDVWKGTMR
ncbi:putative transposase [Escherichia coli]|nr:putative transposase [Escherichia coli]